MTEEEFWCARQNILAALAFGVITEAQARIALKDLTNFFYSSEAKGAA